MEDGNHGEYRPRPDEFTDNGVAFIRAADMDAGTIDFKSASKINERARRRITKGIGAPGDVILSHKGTVGKVALAPKDAPPFVCSPQTTFWRTCDEEHLDPRFLYVFLRSPNFHAQLATRAGETDMAPYVSLTSQRGLSVTIPPIGIQRDIASTIGAIDDKIDLNNRMNATLEGMARAIFKDWFVDFGPTRAKMEGRAPYLHSEIWSFFPERLDPGTFPEGWTTCRLLDVCELKRGYDLPTGKRQEGPFPIVSSSGISGTHVHPMASGPGVVTGRYGTIGEVFYIEGDFWPLNTALYVCDFKGSEPRFIYYLLSGLDFTAYSDKGAVPGINRNHLHEHNVTLVPRKAQKLFVELLGPNWERQQLNHDEIRTLTAIRDLLLPKLMSGEIRVKDAEKAVEAVL